MGMSNCMEIVNRMDQEDQDAVLDKLAQYTGMGMAPERAQVAAVTDVLEELKAERADFVKLVEEQHPDYASRQVNFEVAPDPNDPELLAAWRELDTERRLAISDKVARAIVPKVLKLRKVSGQVMEQFGSYLDDTNPSFALKTSSDLVSEISSDLGYVLSQDSMMNISDEAFPGAEEHGAVIVDMGDVDLPTVERLYNQLRQAIPEIGGQSFVNGRMAIINMQQYSGITTDDLVQKVDALIGEKYTIQQTNIHASFIEKDNYRDHQTLDGQGSGLAQADLWAGLDRLRREASGAIRAELEAAGVQLSKRDVPAGAEAVGLSERDGVQDRSAPLARPEGGRAAQENDAGANGHAVRQLDVDQTGRGFTGFFSNISLGFKGKPNAKPYEPVLDVTPIAGFVQRYNRFRGNFDDHIASSIPTYRELQPIVGAAIAKTYGDADVLDIGGSEGALAKAIAQHSRGRVRAVVLDPNFAMAKHFAKKPVAGAVYDTSAFGGSEDEGVLAWTEDATLTDRDGQVTPNPFAWREVRYFKPDRTFDVVHESMTFQFISRDRDFQVARSKELMAPNGVLILQEKFVSGQGLDTQQFRANEVQKDAYKEQYFTKAEIAAKAKAVGVAEKAAWVEGQQAKEAAVVGMNDTMVSPQDLEYVLGKNFSHVVQFWDSGNFKGYMASDSRQTLDKLLDNMLPTNSEFSNVQTPRFVAPMYSKRDLFGGFANKGTTITQEKVINSRGETRQVKRSNVNSDGQKITGTRQGLENFWNWFDNSWAVDDQGLPLVLYHSSGNDIDTLKTGRESFNNYGLVGNVKVTRAGIFATPNREFSQEYLPAQTDGYGQNVMPVYMSLQEPFDSRALSPTLVSRLQNAGLYDTFKNARNDWALYDNNDDGSNPFVDGLKELGFDGAIFNEEDEDGNEQTTYMAFESTQVKSATGNLGTFNPEDGRLSYSVRDLGFYSELAKQISQASMKQAPAAEWKSFIKALGQKGVKADEVEWSGILDWLDLQTGKVAKADVLAYLDANGVQVEEVVLGAPDYSDVEVWWEDEGGANEETPFNELSPRERADAAARYADETGQYLEGERQTPKYGQYTLPGGTNYREVLLTLPGGKEIGSYAEWLAQRLNITPDDAEDSAEYEDDALHKQFMQEESSKKSSYHSSHWDQPNIIAHLRVNDRTDADGAKVLFVEEIQSDFGQDTKRKGASGTVDAALKSNGMTRTEFDAMPAEDQQFAIDETKRMGLPPAAPFVGNTQGWLNLALKRAIIMAVEGGYQKVAFVNGEQSAERYSLSEQVHRIEYHEYKTPGESRLEAFDRDGDSVISKKAEPDDLPGLIGSELSSKLLATKQNSGGAKVLSGVDMKVGGEGMKAFYDQIVPNAIKALLKKLGGGKLEMVSIPSAKGGWHITPPSRTVSGRWMVKSDDYNSKGLMFDTEAEAKAALAEKQPLLDQSGFSITPELATKVEDGVPLFSKRDFIDTPQFKRWFGDSKVVDSAGKPLVVYHGTNKDFSVFSESKDGGYHFGTKDSADSRMSMTHRRAGKNVMPVYLRIDRLKRVSDQTSSWHEAIKKAKQQGYDGLVYENEWENPGVDSYVVFDPEQIKSATGNNGDFDATNPDIRYSVRSGTSTWDMDGESKFDDIVFKLQNKMIDVRRVIQSITRFTGQVADDLNVYLQEELFHGRAAKRTEDFASQELKPLMQSIKRAGYQLADVEEYLQARHAPEANRIIAQRNPGDPAMADGGSGMTNAAAAAYMASLSPQDAQKLTAIATEVDAIIAQTRQLYVDYGLESQATVTAWGQMFQNYIPLMREDKDGKGGMGIGQGFSVKGKETRGRTGSKRKVVDVLANIAMQRERLIVRGEKNRVSKALYGLVRVNPNPEFWDIGAPPSTRVYDPKTNTVVNRIDPMFKSKDNVVMVKVEDHAGNIVEQAVRFNEDDPRAMRMAAALKNLDAGGLEGLLGISAKITRYFAAVNTQWSPIFGVVNLVRDVQGAMVNLGGTPLAKQKKRILSDTLSALTGIYADIRAERQGRQGTSPWSQLFEEFQKEGGQTGFRDMFKTSADRAKDLEFTLNPDGWADSKVGKLFTANGALKKPVTTAVRGSRVIFDWLSDYNTAMENGVRLAAYKAGLDQGMSKQQAASLAKNLTVNFNRKGDVGMQTGAVYAFFNAAMQGTARMGETLVDMEPGKPKTMRLSSTGKKVVYGGMLLGSLQAFALMAAGFDDDDPPEFLRERSLIIPVGGGSYVSIPMPLGLHVIPGIGRHVTEFALSGFAKPAQRAVDVISMFADAFNPIGNAGLSMQTIAPTALDPFVALSENRDWTGKPIARTSMNKAVPGHTQWKDTATGPAKVLAELINWASGGNEYVAGALSPTPDQIEYLVAQATGGVGRELMKVEQTVMATLRGEDLPTYKVPLAGRFFGSTATQSSQAGVFYANADRLNALETEVKGLRKDGKFQEAMALMKAHPEATMLTRANVAERQIQRLRKEKRELIKQGAERALIKQKETQITEVMTRLNTAMDKFK